MYNASFVNNDTVLMSE